MKITWPTADIFPIIDRDGRGLNAHAHQQCVRLNYAKKSHVSFVPHERP